MNIKGWLLMQLTYRLGAVVGYQQTRFSWTALGGSYSYDNGAEINNLPQEARVIGYKQQFNTPYLGLVGVYRYQNVELNGLLKLTPWVNAKDNDEHYLRNMTFREDIHRSRYYSVALGVGYYLTPAAKVYTEVSASKYEEGKGGTQMLNNKTGEHSYIEGDAAGIDNMHYSVTAGVQFRFL
ncbi:outer membrane protease [Serratia sp. FS14]|nr:outer membrane protease [Serratia sp. FS14]